MPPDARGGVKRSAGAPPVARYNRTEMPSARKVSWAKFRVVMLAICALLILAVLVVLLSGGTIFQAKARLYTYVPDAVGLPENSAVRFNGIPIGKIVKVELSGSRDPDEVVRVTMQVERQYLRFIAADATTDIASEQLPGYKYIDINQGKSPTNVRAGASLKFQPTGDFFKTLDMTQFEARLRAVDELLAGIEAGKGTVGQFVKGNAIYDDTSERLRQLEGALRAAVSTTSTLGQWLYDDEAYQKMAAPLESLDSRLAQLQGDKWFRDSAAYDEIRERLAGIGRVLADLNSGNGAAGRWLRRDELYVNWTRKTASLIEAVDAFNAGSGPLGHAFTSAQLYESLNGAARQMREDIRDFRQDPQKYLRLKLF